MKTILRLTGFLCVVMMHHPELQAMKRPRHGNSNPRLHLHQTPNQSLFIAAHDASATTAATIEGLVTAGADPNTRDTSGVSALQVAAHVGSFHAVRALLENGADVNVWDNHRRTPLHAAIDIKPCKTKHARSAIIKFLLAHGANKWLIPEYSALEHAVLHGDEAACIGLLSTLSEDATEIRLGILVQRDLAQLKTELSKPVDQQYTLQQIALQKGFTKIAALVDPNNTQQFKSMLLGSRI